MFSIITDAVMDSCFCGTLLISWRNMDSLTFTVKHDNDKKIFDEVNQLIATIEVTMWLEEIHGLREETPDK